MNSQDYIKKYGNLAIATTIGTNLFPSVKLAMSAIETNWGESSLANDANNYFGIKAYTNPNNFDVTYANDDLEGEPFRKYNSISSSFIDHTNFLNKENPRYKDAMLVNNPQDQIDEIMNAGYATSHYSDLAKEIIKDNNLERLDTKKN